MRLGRSEVPERAGVEFIPENGGKARVRIARRQTRKKL
jgi:hypothetical protein